MSLSMYDASLPVFARALGILDQILTKAEAFAAEKGIDPASLIEARLIEDMDPLRCQVQRASDSAKGAAARLAGTEIPSYPDTEVTFAELHERIAKTIAYVESVTRDQIEGTEEKEIIINKRHDPYPTTGRDYLFQFALPNFYFHVTTAYDILRHKGVPIGKKDYLGLP